MIAQDLAKIFPYATKDKIAGTADAITVYGHLAEINLPHRLAMYLSQVGAETEGLKYSKEIWGPTPTEQQKKYDPASGSQLSKDLGNILPGDGKKYRGYGDLCVTGRGNVTKFYDWCKTNALKAPNFVDRPELIATTPWATIAALHYWATHTVVDKQTKQVKHINDYADRGNFEMVTRCVNGGLNGFAKRMDYYDRAALVLLGYAPTGISQFQKDAGISVDGISGPVTRAAMHTALVKLTPQKERPEIVTAAPVVDTSQPSDIDKSITSHPSVIASILSVITAAGGKVFDMLSDYRTATVFAVLTVVILLIGIWVTSRNKKKATEIRDTLRSENGFLNQ